MPDEIAVMRRKWFRSTLLIRISVMALLTLIAFTLRIVAYVVNFFLIDSIWLSKKLCLYALNSLKVVCLYIPVLSEFCRFGRISRRPGTVSTQNPNSAESAEFLFDSSVETRGEERSQMLY